MPRPLTPAERLASAEKDITLNEIAKRSTWDRFLVEQAVFHIAQNHDEFDCNMLRDLLPELGHGYLGAVINALRGSGVIEPTGQFVPSKQPATHGHGIHVWRLSLKGHVIAEVRRNARREAAA